MASSQINMVTIDCRSIPTMATFWAAALGAEVVYQDDVFAIIGSTPAVGLQYVAEPTAGKNRVHLDLSTPDGRHNEAKRLCTLGATQVAEHSLPDGSHSWVTLEDPEGNVFCVGDA